MIKKESKSKVKQHSIRFEFRSLTFYYIFRWNRNISPVNFVEAIMLGFFLTQLLLDIIWRIVKI